MNQLHSSTQIPDADPDIAGAVIDHRSGRKTPAVVKVHSFEFRALLQAQRRRLLDEMREIMMPDAANTGIHVPAAEDAQPHTADATDAAMMTVISNSQKLQEIEVALARISDGSYGVCIYCGGGIDRARLKFQPTTRYCLPCQILLISPVKSGGES